MAYKPQEYKRLLVAGYKASDAHKMASYGKERIKRLLQEKVLSNLDTAEKFTRAMKRKWATFFDFKGDIADRLKGFSNANLREALTTKAIPEAGKLFKTRTKDHISYKNAINYHMLISKARTGERYFYKVGYKVFNELDWFATQKFITIISNKKLNAEQVFEKTLETLNQYDEVYKAVPDPSSFEIVAAYYMSQNDYKKLDNERQAKYK